ncbi:MAG: prenyltransferase/squalene oxidase repeat-containing protein [Planctomycetota bacterium]
MTSFLPTLLGIVLLLGIGATGRSAGQGPSPAMELARRNASAQADLLALGAITALAERQDPATGSWGVSPGRPVLPAVTGLALTGLLMDPGVSAADPIAAKAIDFILSHQQPDGGIYDRILPSYNTAICVSALALARDGSSPRAAEIDAAIARAVPFLRGLQWGEDAVPDPALGDIVASVGPEHPFYGGVGYGRSGRPDNSNLNLWLQALHDAGVPGDDPAVQRALAFLERTQMLDEVNDMDYAEGSQQGGFIYATSPSGDRLGVGESKAGTVDEVDDDGNVVSRLRAYGSMTYAGFKSLAFADLDADDPRTRAARRWIEANYTMDENPGLGSDGQYYYYMIVGRAMSAWDEPRLTDRSRGLELERRWDVDLVNTLTLLQEPGGLFRVIDDRWMESDPMLITSYALIGVQAARRSLQTP